ncbi:DUF7010 family protein [Neobacillus massiliamazoniensis]|uniref:Uncharacterized protein n=1 Tax=Neobacillus massiliamazoniensis TaxID=1499688 RepID=A0A0U1P4A1_9BACI|nr:hypothetical protein [Neobacillus massiliamazoniensis]CRK85097.1 hypothetical protein BN000_05157 [Neobacillus massiliamazoniensis]
MSQTSNTIPRAAVRGMASGVIFMAFFGTLWAYTGVMGLQGWGVPLLLVAAVIIGIALFIGGLLLIRASRELKNQFSKEDLKRGKSIRFWFNIIFAAEGLAIVISIVLCNATRHSELIPLIIAIIVGVHFLPLAHLFQVKLYYFTGTLLCLLAIFTLLFIPEKATLGEYQINAFMSVVGLGSALILWGTGLAILLMGIRLLGAAQNKQTDSRKLR